MEFVEYRDLYKKALKKVGTFTDDELKAFIKPAAEVEDPRRIVFISHPIGGDIQNNLAALRRIVRFINLNFPDIVPFVPFYVDVVAMNDGRPEERQRAISNIRKVISSTQIDELWLCGPVISNGMLQEKGQAEALGIKVVDKTGTLAETTISVWNENSVGGSNESE